MTVQFSVKFNNTKFHEYPLIGSRVAPCGQTDGRMHRLTLIGAIQHCERA